MGDYGVTFFTYDLQTYADAFKKDGVPFFVAQWEAEKTKDTWYSLFFLANAPHYVIELASARQPTLDLKTLPKLDFEEMLWAEHAGTIGNNANSMIDMYTENHYAQPMNSAGMSKLATHFKSNDPYPITKDTRLAYACKQSYIIDPTGWSIQPIGAGTDWPKCSGESNVMV